MESASMKYNKVGLFQRIIELGLLSDFLDFARFMYYDRRYSLFNSALIYLQRPGVLYVESEIGWKKHGRDVNPNAIPIVVLQPFGPVDFLYELEDTYGKEFLKVKRNDFDNSRKIPFSAKDYDNAVRMLYDLGISYSEAPLGTRMHGNARVLETEKILHPKGPGKKERHTRYEVVVNVNKTDEDKTLTIFHEAGHILCGHIRDPKNTDLKVPNRSNEELAEDTKEYEAEMVCQAFCKVLGYEYDPSAYMRYYDEEVYTDQFSLRYVMEAADKMIANW